MRVYNLTDTIIARFWTKVDKRGPDECWPWLGSSIPKDGRGTFWVKSRSTTAPRFSLLVHGVFPEHDGLFACHACDNPTCVNPAHLWWGTCSDNSRDASAKGRTTIASKAVCKNGHPLTEDNIEYRKAGLGTCRICFVASKQRYEHSERGRALKAEAQRRRRKARQIARRALGEQP